MTKKRVIIIAEAGVNHNGDRMLMEQLVIEAANSGADYVKFQTFIASRLVSKKAPKAEYQVSGDNDDGLQYNMLKALELTVDDHNFIIDTCRKNNIGFLSSAFD